MVLVDTYTSFCSDCVLYNQLIFGSRIDSFGPQWAQNIKVITRGEILLITVESVCNLLQFLLTEI